MRGEEPREQLLPVILSASSPRNAEDHSGFLDTTSVLDAVVSAPVPEFFSLHAACFKTNFNSGKCDHDRAQNVLF